MPAKEALVPVPAYHRYFADLPFARNGDAPSHACNCRCSLSCRLGIVAGKLWYGNLRALGIVPVKSPLSILIVYYDFPALPQGSSASAMYECFSRVSRGVNVKIPSHRTCALRREIHHIWTLFPASNNTWEEGVFASTQFWHTSNAGGAEGSRGRPRLHAQTRPLVLCRVHGHPGLSRPFRRADFQGPVFYLGRRPDGDECAGRPGGLGPRRPRLLRALWGRGHGGALHRLRYAPAGRRVCSARRERWGDAGEGALG